MKKEYVTRKPCKCPKCGGKVGKILYGYCIVDEKLEAEIEAGKYVVGGCCITEDDPDWQCTQCGKKFWKPGSTIQSRMKR